MEETIINEETPVNSIVTEIEADDELKRRLGVATQHKEPTTEKVEAWNWDAQPEDFKKSENVAEEETTKKTEAKSTDKPEEKSTEKPKGKMSDAAKRSSARIATGMFDLTQKSIAIPVLNNKYKKKFSAEEQERLLKLDITPKTKHTEEDKLLSAKFEKMMARREKKMADAPLNKTESEDLEEAWYMYFDVEEKELPPIYFVCMAMINSMGKRAIDIFTD